MSEDIPSDIGLPEGALCESIQIPPQCANSGVFPYLPSSGTEYNPGVVEQDRLPTYTGLDDYDTLFEARHGRGAIDSAPRSDEGVLAAFLNSDAYYNFKYGYDRKPYDCIKIRNMPLTVNTCPLTKEDPSL